MNTEHEATKAGDGTPETHGAPRQPTPHGEGRNPELQRSGHGGAKSVRDFLFAPNSGVEAPIGSLINQFYDRADRRRGFARGLLFIIFIVVVAGIAAVVFVGGLMELDVLSALRSQDAFIEETTQKMEQATTEAIELATSALEGYAWAHKSIDGTTRTFADVDFVDANVGWIIGDKRAIFATTDGGATWTSQSSGSSGFLYYVHFAGAKVGWVVGDKGTILATTDGGATWTPQTSNTSGNFYSVHFAGAKVGWVVGDKGTILATTDGGATWTPQTSNTSENLYCVHFADVDVGWVVGGKGTILATIDGGATWTPQTSNISGNIEGVDFVDANKGWVVGQAGMILATTDGGATWESQSSVTSEPLINVDFVDAKTGWVVGRAGTILATTDGGANWESLPSGTSAQLNAVDFVDANVGWVVGWEGTVLKNDRGVARRITEQLKEVKSPSRITELLEKEGLERTLQRNDTRQQIETQSIRYTELQKLLGELPKGADRTARESRESDLENFFGRHTIIRFGIMFFIAFFLQLLVSLYRYNMRLAAFYDARGDALFFATLKGDALDAVTETFSPDSVDYGRSPKLATKQVVDLAKSLSQGMDSPRRA